MKNIPALLFFFILTTILQVSNGEFSIPVSYKTMLFSYGNATKNLVDPGNTTLDFVIADYSAAPSSEFTWSVNDEEKTFRHTEPGVVAKMPYYYYEKAGNNLRTVLVLDNEKAVPGEYKLNITDGQYIKTVTQRLNSIPILPEVHKPKRVLEGDSLKLKCNAKSYPAISQYKWEFSPMDSEGKDDEESQMNALTKFTEVVGDNNKFITDEGALLTIKSLKKEDNGLYRCTATNNIGNDKIIYYVNVKNRWAALWPFIGIVIEVAVLVSAILLYERHAMKNKSQPDAATRISQSQNNVAPIVNNQENNPDNKDTIRERNVLKT